MRVIDQLGSAERRPPLSRRDQVLGVAFGLWMIVGLFLDGWAHDNNRPESFFTPWHGVLYSGFAAASIAAVAIVWRPGRSVGDALKRLPRGHGLTLLALGVFSIAAFGDLVWHEVLGVEVGVEALLSPTHLALLGSGLIALSAPLRTAWKTSDQATTLRSMMPAVFSLALLTALVGFFLLYLSPFVNDTAGVRFDRLPHVPHNHPSENVAELQQILGVASILFTSVLLSVPIHLLFRRWRPPFGSFTVLVGTVVFLFVGLGEFAQPWMILAGVLAGVAIDLVADRVPPWAAGAIGVLVLWVLYFGLYQLTEGGIAWSAELWAGTAVLAAMLAAGVGLLNLSSAHSAPT